MQDVIAGLRNELIRTVSAIDAWFDKDIELLRKDIGDAQSAEGFIAGMVASSKHLLDTIKYNGAITGPMDIQFPRDSFAAGQIARPKGKLSDARTELRAQLDRCLIYLEDLAQQKQTGLSPESGDIAQLSGYQGIYLWLVHLKRHVGQLNTLSDRFDHHDRR